MLAFLYLNRPVAVSASPFLVVNTPTRLLHEAHTLPNPSQAGLGARDHVLVTGAVELELTPTGTLDQSNNRSRTADVIGGVRAAGSREWERNLKVRLVGYHRSFVVAAAAAKGKEKSSEDDDNRTSADTNTNFGRIA